MIILCAVTSFVIYYFTEKDTYSCDYLDYDEETNKAEIEKLEQINNVQISPQFLSGIEAVMSVSNKVV